MVIDSSAIVAILLGEAETADFSMAIERDVTRLICAPSVLECHMRLHTVKGPAGVLALETLLNDIEADVRPADAPLVRIAGQAFEIYGRGRHQAGLNFGDCFVYALAKQTGEPILFKGNDFSKTDLEPVMASR